MADEMNVNFVLPGEPVENMTDPPALTLIPRRMPKRFNGRALGDDRPEVLVHPEDASAAGITDGDVVEVASETGRLRLTARVTDAIHAGAVSISHGWTDANVNVLVSSHDLDPLTGMRFRAAASSFIAPATASSRSVMAARAASHSVWPTTGGRAKVIARRPGRCSAARTAPSARRTRRAM